jgi:predicted transposase YdaD
MVRQLLETCVDEDWVREIEIQALEPMPSKMVDKRLVRRENDLLLRARYRGRDAYVLIVLEFQSSPDRFMTLRLATYVCMVWLSLVERSRTNDKAPVLQELPAVFPVVLYNGERAWNAPRRLEELVAGAELGDLQAYVPRFTHHLIEERSFPRERLEEARNLISALFTLESGGELSLKERTAKVAKWFRVRFHADNRRDGEVRAEDMLLSGDIEMNLESAIKKHDEEVREESRRERDLEVARKALAKGMSPQEVAELTDLPLEEVQKLAH